MNTPNKGFLPQKTFFALWVNPEGENPITRCLEGAVEDYQGSNGSLAPNHGLPRFRKSSFKSAYPFGQVSLSDPDVPVTAQIQAFNPLIPGDADSSGLPMAMLRFTLTNLTAKPAKAAICANMQNFIGFNNIKPEHMQKNNFNEFRPPRKHE